MMDPNDNGIFNLAERKLSWLGRRQQVLAQNVANANTPGYQPRDVAPFATELSRLAAGQKLAQTSPAHMPAASNPAEDGMTRGRERAPDGNSVSMEDQLTKVADTVSSQELVANLYRKYNGLFRIALGRS